MYNNDDFNEEENSYENESYQASNPILEFYNANKIMIWIFGGIIVVVLIISLFFGGGSSNNTVTPKEPVLIINSTTEKVTINKSIQLYAKVEGENYAIFEWSSDDPNIATVNNNGVVTGVNYGTATITVTYNKNGKPYTKECEVTVIEGDPNVSISKVEFPKGDVMINPGDTFKLQVITTPTTGYVKDMTFTSYNENVVSVDEDGYIKALKEGRTTIKVTINNTFSSEIDVFVVNKTLTPQIVINPTNFQFPNSNMEVFVGENFSLDYNYEPRDASINNLTWKSSNPSVATINNGIVTGLSQGTTTITVEALNGVNGVVNVTVKVKTIPVQYIQILSGTNVSLYVGGTSQISANVSPYDATNKTLSYYSSNPSVASVSNNGNITAISPGNAQIIVTSIDGGKSATVNVVVNSNSSSGGSNGGTSSGSTDNGSSGSTGSDSGSSGGSTSGGTSGGSSSSSTVGTIKFRDAKGNGLANSVDSALENNNTSPVTVSISSGTVTKLKYCVQKCSSTTSCNNPTCTPNTEISMGESIKFTQGNGIYVIKSIKYNGSKSEDVKLKFVNIGGVTSLSGSTTSNKACYLIDGEYKWTTESEAKTLDSNAVKVSSRDTQSECEGTGSSSTSNKIDGTITNLAGPPPLGVIVNDQVVIKSTKKMAYMYYCISSGSCSIDTHTTNSYKTSYSLMVGKNCYVGDLGKTYIIKFSTTGTSFAHCVTGSKGNYISYVAEFTDGTKSPQIKLQLK